MMKMIAILFLCNIIFMNLIDAQECYVCDQGCDHPGQADIKTCSESGDGGQSGKTFVNGALDIANNGSYTSIKTNFDDYVKTTLNLNTTLVDWAKLTGWTCYVTKDKRRGCLLMGKGFCTSDKSWLGQLATLGDKINSIMNKAKTAIGTMFSGVSLNDDEQKANISSWFAQNYLSPLVNNTKDPQFQLDSCCEGPKCNFASMIQKSTAVLIVLLLSIFILV